MSDMHYAFHPEHGNKVVPTAEYEKLLGEGWYDSPDKFPKKKLKGLGEAEPTTPPAGRSPGRPRRQA